MEEIPINNETLAVLPDLPSSNKYDDWEGFVKNSLNTHPDYKKDIQTAIDRMEKLDGKVARRDLIKNKMKPIAKDVANPLNIEEASSRELVLQKHFDDYVDKRLMPLIDDKKINPTIKNDILKMVYGVSQEDRHVVIDHVEGLLNKVDSNEAIIERILNDRKMIENQGRNIVNEGKALNNIALDKKNTATMLGLLGTVAVGTGVSGFGLNEIINKNKKSEKHNIRRNGKS